MSVIISQYIYLYILHITFQNFSFMTDTDIYILLQIFLNDIHKQ